MDFVVQTFYTEFIKQKEVISMINIAFDMRRIGATIAQLRREHNMTQMQLADEMGVSFQAVSNWERGDYQN